MKKNIKPRRKRWLWPIVVVAVLGVVAWFADRKIKQRDHPGLVTFVRQWARNYPASFAVEPLSLEMNVDASDMARLEQFVEEARERGVILQEGNEPVSASLSGPDGTFKAKVRIKGKLTDHVKGSKWSFRVIAKKNEGFLGMRRFSLQHPGTRNYLCDWLFHRMMEGEGVIALRYGFIRLGLNGDDLGVYAYEEHFGPELLENNGRVEGPIFRFDPSLFWEHRLNMMNKVRYNEAFAAYQAAEIDAFGSSDLEKDPKARALFEEAVTLMESFRRAERPASEVFHIDLIARRHAMLDLIGGHHSMDWSDVKFYYDPVLRRIEPVSYESFSAFPLSTLAGSDRWVGRQDPAQELHDALFNDETLFRAYVHHLERMSAPAYLDSVFTALGPAIDSASATLYREFPYKELDRSIYYKNQRVIRRMLDVPKPFHAFFGGVSSDTLRVTIVPIEGLPMEIHGVKLPTGTTVPPMTATIIPVRRKGQPGQPVEVRFVIPMDAGGVNASDIRVVASVLGASKQREVAVAEHAFILASERTLGLPSPSDLTKVPFLRVDGSQRTITILPGSWSLAEDLSLPAGYTVLATAPLRLVLGPGVRFISRSAMEWKGLPESPIEVIGGGGRGGLFLLDAGKASAWKHVAIDRVGEVVVQASTLRMDQVTMKGDEGSNVLQVVRSKVNMTDGALQGGSDQMEVQASTVVMDAMRLEGAADDALVVRGGSVELKGCQVAAENGLAVKCSVLAEVHVQGSQLKGGGQGVIIQEGARFIMQGGAVHASKVAVKLEDRKGLHGPSTFRLEQGDLDAPTPIEPGKGNTVHQVAIDPSANEH